MSDSLPRKLATAARSQPWWVAGVFAVALGAGEMRAEIHALRADVDRMCNTLERIARHLDHTPPPLFSAPHGPAR